MRTIQNLEVVFEREKQEPEQLFDFSCSILLLLFCRSFFSFGWRFSHSEDVPCGHDGKVLALKLTSKGN